MLRVVAVGVAEATRHAEVADLQLAVLVEEVARLEVSGGEASEKRYRWKYH